MGSEDLQAQAKDSVQRNTEKSSEQMTPQKVERIMRNSYWIQRMCAEYMSFKNV